MKYFVTVRYRTKRGCKIATHYVEAPNITEACNAACEQRRNRPGVVKIDGGGCVSINRKDEREPS